MTQEEVDKIITILKTADGGCKYCVAELLEKFYKDFPEWKPLKKKKDK